MANYDSSYTGEQVDAAVAATEAIPKKIDKYATISGESGAASLITGTIFMFTGTTYTDTTYNITFVNGCFYKKTASGLEKQVSSEQVIYSNAAATTFNALNFVKCTAAEYSALTPDANTFYMITG